MELNEVLEQYNQVLKDRIVLLEENVKLLQKMVELTGNEVKQWEYMEISRTQSNDLNKLGEQGWEVTGTFSTNAGSSSILLKRQKQKIQQKQTEPNYSYGR